MHQRGHVHELHGHGRTYCATRGTLAGAQEQHERAQALAAGPQRTGGVAAETRAVARGDLQQPLLGLCQPARELGAADRE